MLWYDAINNKNSIYSLEKYKKKSNSTENKYSFNNKPLPIKNNKYNFMYTLPPLWKVVLVKNTLKSTYHLFMYSTTYFIKIPVPTTFSLPNFDSSTSTISFSSPYINNTTILYGTVLAYFYKALIKPLFMKLKFKGKGYYIYKNYRNTITPQFGYSHRLYLYAYFLFVKFLSKTTLIIFGLNPLHINQTGRGIFSWRPLNIFTGRGVRFSKQIVYKKSGKVSTYR
jgi:hypothetical protein